MLRKTMLFASVVLMAWAAYAAAQPVPVEFSGQVRVRNENDGRDFNSDTGFKSFNPMRTQLGVTVHPVEDMKVFVQVQDARVLGGEDTSTLPGVSDPNTLDLHQGFFQVDNLGWEGFGVKFGRMETRWGNERLLGVTDWANVPTAFDGGIVGIDRERAQAQVMWSKLVERDTPIIGTPDTENSDRTLLGGYGMVGLNEYASVDVQVLNVRDKVTVSEDDDAMLTTVAGRVFGEAASRWDYSVEGAYQTGTQETGPATEIDLGGWMFGGEVGVTVGAEERPVRFGVGYDHLSGDDASTTDKVETFSTLFGDNHKYYGLMDVPQVLSSTGVRDIKVNAKATVWRNTDNVVSFGGEFHNFAAAETATGGESAIGNEVDVHATWTYRERFIPTLGVSAFLPGDAIPGPVPGASADNAYWVYLQGVVSF